MKRGILSLCLLVALVLGVTIAPGVSQAAVLRSSNYTLSEARFSGGMSARGCSTNFCARTSLGELTVGETESANYRASFAPEEPEMPLLQVITELGDKNFGVLDPLKTSMATTKVMIRNHLTEGYTVHLTGEVPNNGSHSLHASELAEESKPGTELFGVNMAANDEMKLGANPTYNPAENSLLAKITGNYNQAGKFAYRPEAIMADNRSGSGQTDYTLSMVINVSNMTPKGEYATSLSVVVIPVF